jgi:hypothetical protein
MTNKTVDSFLLWYVLCFILLFCFCSCSSQIAEPGKTTNQGTGGITSKPLENSGSTEAVPLSAPIEKEAENVREALSKNEPKVDKAYLAVETVKGNDCLKVVAEGSDKNGDKVPLRFQWTKNGEPAGEGDTISGLKRGDKVSVMIVPFDDWGNGLARSLTAEIKNTPPTIVEHQDANFDGKAWSYQVKATDPDGDPLIYSLKSAPAGMTINPLTGLIKWNVPAGFTGKASFTVSVDDSHGGEASQSLTIDIKPEQKRQKD